MSDPLFGKHAGDPLTDPIPDLAVDRAHDPGTGTAATAPVLHEAAPTGGGARVAHGDHGDEEPSAPGKAPRSLSAVPSAEQTQQIATPPPGAPEEKREVVVCPSCHKGREVALNRRHAMDFCPEPGCDFPLFWTPSQIDLGTSDTEADSLRRRPGTDGRVTVASRACPHCDEANPLEAETCLRCGLPMILLAPTPPPEPVVVAPPAPAPVEPRRTPLWVWIVLALTTLVALGLIVWAIAAS